MINRSQVRVKWIITIYAKCVMYILNTILTCISGFRCMCEPGYTGKNCEMVYVPCDPSPCSNNGRCMQIDDLNYECKCKSGNERNKIWRLYTQPCYPRFNVHITYIISYTWIHIYGLFLKLTGHLVCTHEC